MEKFSKLTGIVACMELSNIDTDMIIPKQFLKTIKRSGLGKGLFSVAPARQPFVAGHIIQS